MITTTKRAVAVLMPLPLTAGMAAQTQRPRLTLKIRGCTVETHENPGPYTCGRARPRTNYEWIPQF